MIRNPFIKDSVIIKYQTLIDQINSLETYLKTLTDKELRNTSFQLKKQYHESQDLS